MAKVSQKNNKMCHESFNWACMGLSRKYMDEDVGEKDNLAFLFLNKLDKVL